MTRGILVLIISLGIGSALFASAHVQIHDYNQRALTRLEAVNR